MVITNKQANVILKMSQGWGISENNSLHADMHIKLQNGGIGSGGRVEQVNGIIFNSLYDKKIIYPKGWVLDPQCSVKVVEYVLTKKGKLIAKNII